MPRGSEEFVEWMFEREEIDRQTYEEYFDIEPTKPSIMVRLHEFSSRFSNFFEWSRKTTSKTSAYQRRIERYFRKYPDATLAEARGHKK